MIQTNMNYRNYIEDQLYFQGREIAVDTECINNTTKDMLIIYTTGQMAISKSNLKPSNVGRPVVNEYEDGSVIEIDFDASAMSPLIRNVVKDYTDNNHKNIVLASGGFPEMVEKFYYGTKHEYSLDSNGKMPTLGHPILIRNKSMTFLLALFDTDEEIRRLSDDIKRAGSPFNYVQRYFNDEVADLGFGMQYVNLSPDNLYYASYAQRRVITIPALSRSDVLYYIDVAFKDDHDMYNQAMRAVEDNNHVYLIVRENDSYHIEQYLRDDEALLRTGSLQSTEPEKDGDIIPIFYSYIEAENYINNYDGSPLNVYLKTAAEEASAEAQEVIANNTVENKKKMTAIAKVCASMVTTGVAYGLGRSAILAIVDTIEKKKKKGCAAAIVNNIIRRNNISNMIRTSIGSSLAKSSLINGSMGMVSGYLTPMACGVTAASAAIPIAAPIIIGAAVVMSTVITTCIVCRNKIRNFIEDHPVVEKTLNVVKNVAIGIAVAPIAIVAGIGYAIWTGIKTIGQKIADFFGWF